MRIFHELDGLGQPRFFAIGAEPGSRVELPSRIVNDRRGRVVELTRTGVWCSLEDGAADVARRFTNLLEVTGIAGVVGQYPRPLPWERNAR